MRYKILNLVGVFVYLLICLFFGYHVFLYALGKSWSADTFLHLLRFLLETLLVGGIIIAMLSLTFSVLFPKAKYFWGVAYVLPILLVGINGGPVWVGLAIAYYLLSLTGVHLGLLYGKKYVGALFSRVNNDKNNPV